MNVIKQFIFFSIFLLLTIHLNLFSQECKGDSYFKSDTLYKECGAHDVILSGKELCIKNYFKVIAYEDLSNQCCESIVNAINKLNSKDKVTHTIWILEEVKNRSMDIREKIYSTLLKVNYPKPAYLLKPMINGYFTNYREPYDSLSNHVNVLHWSMIK